MKLSSQKQSVFPWVIWTFLRDVPTFLFFSHSYPAVLHISFFPADFRLSSNLKEERVGKKTFLGFFAGVILLLLFFFLDDLADF